MSIPPTLQKNLHETFAGLIRLDLLSKVIRTNDVLIREYFFHWIVKVDGFSNQKPLFEIGSHFIKKGEGFGNTIAFTITQTWMASHL